MQPAPARPMVSVNERNAFTFHGLIGLLLGFVLLGAGAGTGFVGVQGGVPWLIVVGILVAIAGLASWGGMFILQPNQAMVLVFLGKYTGTVKGAGWHWVNPFTRKQ